MELHLQTVQRSADDPRRLGLAGQLKGQHVPVRLNVAGSRLHRVSLPGRGGGDERKEGREGQRDRGKKERKKKDKNTNNMGEGPGDRVQVIGLGFIRECSETT